MFYDVKINNIWSTRTPYKILISSQLNIWIQLSECKNAVFSFKREIVAWVSLTSSKYGW